MRWCECKKENEPETKLLKPLKRLDSHPSFLFRANACVPVRHTETLNLIKFLPSLLITPSLSILSPSFYKPLFSLHLLSPFHYYLFTTSLLSPPRFSTPSFFVMIRTFSPQHLSVSLDHPSIPSFSQPLYLSFLFFLAPTCCILKLLLYHLSHR